MADVASGAFFAVLLVDVEVVFARRCYLRKVRHRQDLHTLSHTAQYRGDALGRLARYARVDLVKDDGREATAVSDERLEGEHQT